MGWFLCGVALAMGLHHAVLHVTVVAEPMPLTLREAAFIQQADALLDREAPAQYSWESLPGHANVYGPAYPAAVVPMVALWRDQPYQAHRVMVALFLLAGAGLLAWGVARHGGWINGGIAAAWFYAAQVASPSLAAGPDLLAVLCYVGAMVLVHRGGARCGPALAGALVLGMLGLLTKPYAVLVVPALLVWIALADSPRRAVVWGVGTALTVLLGGAVVQRIWPAYFLSVFGLHAAFATRVFGELVAQVREFTLLNGPLLVLLIPVVADWVVRTRKGALAWPWQDGGRRPILDPAPGWSFWLTAVAASALLLSLGWHGGAFLIYFNHLLLPPLLLAVLGREPLACAPGRFGWRPALVVANLLWLAWLRPALPAEPWIPELPPGPVLADPLLEPLVRLHPGAELVDNGQAEYLVIAMLASGDERQVAIAHNWEQALARRIARQEFAHLLLVGYHNRRVLAVDGEVTEFLGRYYEMVAVQRVRPYYVSFRDRRRFGRTEINVVTFRPRALEPEIVGPANSSALQPD